MRSASQTRLSIRLALASVASAVAVAVVCGVGLFSMRGLANMSRQAVERQIDLIDDGAAFQRLLYQKGFVANYALTRDPEFLTQLEASRHAFEAWLARQQTGADEQSPKTLLGEIERVYRDYDAGRSRVIELLDSRREEEARPLMRESHGHLEQLLELTQQYGTAGRRQAERALAASERSIGRLASLLVGTSLAGIAASLVLGFLWARRFARPIYELQLKIESAAQKTRIEVSPGREGLEALDDHIAGLVRRLEDTDALLVEQRRRLGQSEKMSAVGELAAKLAHEILNPLAGMKAAVQLMAMNPDAAAAAGIAATTLEREISRVQDLVRRLVDYSRPLSPRIEVCPVPRLLDEAVAAAAPVLTTAGVMVHRDGDADLPPLELDRMLMTHVLVNLLVNAAQAMPDGGRIHLRSRRAVELGREHVVLQVEDEGTGIPPERMSQVFHPFFTTKADGHGLGLAISQNIVFEHGGRIHARNRDDARGAAFDVWIPVVR